MYMPAVVVKRGSVELVREGVRPSEPEAGGIRRARFRDPLGPPCHGLRNVCLHRHG
jgi:hypothetical protein